MSAHTVIIDVEGRGRTGWTPGRDGAPGRFIGAAAVEAQRAAAARTTTPIRYGATAIASDLTALGAIAAIVATAGDKPWHLIGAPRELLNLVNS